MATYNRTLSASDVQGIVGRNSEVSTARSLGIGVAGLSQLRASFRSMDAGAAKDMQAGLKRAMRPTLAASQALAPSRTGALRGSLKAFSAGNSFGIRSRLPYANFAHWGGSTGRGHKPGQPWSGSVKNYRPALFISKAIEHNEQRIVDDVAAVIDRHAAQTGWR